MKNASNPYNAMAGFYRAPVAVSALTLCFLFFASPVQANYIYDNSTGTWKPTSSTVIAPAGSSSPFNHVPRETSPTVSSTGDFQTKTGGTFGSPPVNGVSRTVPVTVTGTTTNANVKKSLISRLTKGGVAGIAIGFGIESLLNGIGAFIDEGGKVARKQPVIPQREVEGLYYGYGKSQSRDYELNDGDHIVGSYTVPPNPSTWYRSCSKTTTSGGSTLYLQAYHLTGAAPYHGVQCGYSRSPTPTTKVPVPPTVLDDAVYSNYQPHPSDYPFLASDPAMIPTVVAVDPIPRVDFPPVITTTVDLDTGITTTVETNIWHDFNIKDNNTTQPKIDANTTTKTNTYVDGSKTNESTTTTSTGVGSQPTGSAGGSSSPAPETPIDCDLFPTACAWIEWTKEEPEEPDDNLSALLKEVPISSKTHTITGGAAACPAPLVLNLSQFGSREVSYQPLCDLASTMKYLYLALMSFAAAVLLNRSINRV